jgi:hypothetical protein
LFPEVPPEISLRQVPSPEPSLHLLIPGENQVFPWMIY